MAASAWLLPTPGLPAATKLTASSRKAPLRKRSSCSRMSGGNCSSCRVRKVLSGGKPRETLQASDAMLFALQALGADQLIQEGFVGQVGLGGFQRQVLVQRG